MIIRGAFLTRLYFYKLVQNIVENMKKILVGISGGIAAYKVANVVSKLTQAGHDVRVVMTENATKFIAPLTFASLTRQKVLTSVFPNEMSGEKM